MISRDLETDDLNVKGNAMFSLNTAILIKPLFLPQPITMQYVFFLDITTLINYRIGHRRLIVFIEADL